MKLNSALLATLIFWSVILQVQSSSIVPLSVADHLQLSDAVFRGTVVGISCFKDATGLIYTRTSLRVDEPFKGKFPAMIEVVHRGGQVGDSAEFAGYSPQFRMGGDYLVFVTRRHDGKLSCTQGSASALLLAGKSAAGTGGEWVLDEVRQLTRNGTIPGSDVTDQVGEIGRSTALLSGMLDGIAARFLQPDRGEPIPYLVDATSLPAGMSLAQATNALEQALNAWTAVTSLKFRFESFQNFGMAAANVVTNDEKIRIQLHDNYNFITEPGVLGKGGRASLTSPLSGVGWDIGGNVAGNEFQRSFRGYVVLEATNVVMQNVTNFAEVLCHEIGHVLNLAHSSENSNEANPTLKQAMMYYQVHAGGRGATLGVYDPPIIQQIYPSNTPPFSFDRMLDVVTAQSTPSVPGINEVELNGYDLQSTGLTFTAANPSSINGTFNVAGRKIRFTPAGQFFDSPRFDPAGLAYNDIIYGRFSDGTNGSPYVRVKVISLTGDSDDPSDGLPDYWTAYYFGHPDPRAADKSQAGDDADGDGLSNLQEFIAGTNPTNAASAERITSYPTNFIQWQAKAFELYEVLGSTDFVNWSPVGIPVQPVNVPIQVRTTLPDISVTATNLNLPTVGPRMFFRVRKMP